MQLAVSLDYDSITFTAPVLADNNVAGMSIRYKKNCGTIVTKDLTSVIPSIQNESLTLNVTDLYTDNTVFDDGVYYFRITVTGPLVEDEPGTTYLTGCIYIGTTSRCKALCMYENTGDEIYKYIINALSIVNDCDDCDCTTMCELYDYLNTLLSNTSTSTNNVYNSCGCN